jgi:uncharacterized protein (TIGR03000 family)
MRKRRYAAAAVAAVVLLLVYADISSAQLFRRGGRGYYGGYGGRGYGAGYYGGMGYGGYGWGGPGYGYSPIYGPGYAGSYLAPGYVSSGMTVLPGNTTSFYYQPGTQLGAAVSPNAALIDVRVPPDAQVTFDGDATTQTGPNRVFSSPPLEAGKSYHYDVKARWTQNGRPVERTRRVDVRAGQRTTVDFTQDRDRDRNTDRTED